jgi:hypothetical protein
MSESLIVKDGNGSVKSLQVDSGSNGYISNHTLVSTVTGSDVSIYYTNGPSGWDWNSLSGTVSVAALDNSRKSIVINNNSEAGKCYVIMGTSSFGVINDMETAPPVYSFLLDSGGTYFADSSTAALQHLIYVPSSSNIPTAQSMSVVVTQIY